LFKKRLFHWFETTVFYDSKARSPFTINPLGSAVALGPALQSRRLTFAPKAGFSGSNLYHRDPN
jgi:hypothetical protein